MRRRWPDIIGTATATLAIVVLSVVLGACGGGGHSSSSPTTVPEALWLGQARVWVAAHGPDLTAISDAAKNLGDAAKSGNSNLSQIAATQFLVKVGQADGDLPTNDFGHDLHKVFIAYASALAMIRNGIVKNDQRLYKQGSDALAAAVKQFGAITARMNASP